MSNLIDGYTLLDSGEGRKLEQFGSCIIDRPSSLSTWRRRESDTVWDSADAAYTPPDRWEHQGRSFETWEATVDGVKLELELMSNGQLGIFPEHALYLPKVKAIAERLSNKGARPLRVLNLFAYSFMAREHRKGSLYDIVIIDPPSFSRVSKNNSWTLEEKAPEIVELTLNVLEPRAGAVFFTNHSTASTSDVVRNISLDMYNDSGVEISIESLSLQEQKTSRLLPAGSLITLFHSIDSQ